MFKAIYFIIGVSIGTSAMAQDWSDASAAMHSALATGRTVISSNFFPDNASPEAATRGLGVIYAHINGSAGNSSVEAGLFEKDASGWKLHRRVDGLFGHSPYNPQVGADGFFVTTATLGPDDPRCCPTSQTTWFIDWSTGLATPR